MLNLRSSRALPARFVLVLVGLASMARQGAAAITLTLHPAVPLVTPGTHLALRLEARDDSGNALPLSAVTWSLTPGSGQATLSADGVLTGITPGTLSITAQTNQGALSAHAYVLSPAGSVRLAVPEVVGDSRHRSPRRDRDVRPGRGNPHDRSRGRRTSGRRPSPPRRS